jgi:hypothetical protein
MVAPESFLVKRQVTLTNADNEGATHFAGDVLSDWELTDLIKSKIKDGIPWYIQSFEALTDKEAKLYRVKATSVEGKRQAPNGQIVDPPWDDFIGLNPKEIIDRMEHLSFEDVEKVRQYERAGMNRASIIEYVAPSEREPWNEYDSWSVRDTLEKMDILDPQSVQDVIVYEMHHQKRAAVISFEIEDDDPVIVPQANTENDKDEDTSGAELAGVGADSE